MFTTLSKNTNCTKRKRAKSCQISCLIKIHLLHSKARGQLPIPGGQLLTPRGQLPTPGGHYLKHPALQTDKKGGRKINK